MKTSPLWFFNNLRHVFITSSFFQSRPQLRRAWVGLIPSWPTHPAHCGPKQRFTVPLLNFKHAFLHIKYIFMMVNFPRIVTIYRMVTILKTVTNTTQLYRSVTIPRLVSIQRTITNHRMVTIPKTVTTPTEKIALEHLFCQTPD